jgi:hypothetical protein
MAFDKVEEAVYMCVRDVAFPSVYIDFTFPTVNYPFISSNIPEYGVYISQLIRYSRVSAQYSDFLVRAQLLMQNLLKQVFVCPSIYRF